MVPLSLTLEGSPDRVNSGVSRPGQRPTAPEGGRFCAVSLPPNPQEGPHHKAHRTAVACAHPRSGAGLSLPWLSASSRKAATDGPVQRKERVGRPGSTPEPFADAHWPVH